MTGTATAVFLAVVAARFLVPLLIPRYPLPAIVTALILDGVDQTIFQSFGFDPPGYQGYDKAMDVYYLAIAYLSTMRNWTSRPAVQVARFLYFYRLIGVVAFELTEWRPLLLIFPNTFEYFFIAYEMYRLFWNPARVSQRSWLLAAGGIWVFIKLPQEWWIHIAQLDVTETIAAVRWFGPAIVAVVTVVCLTYWFAVRPRQPAPDWTWHVAADPLPNGWAHDRRPAPGRLLSTGTLEMVVLIGLLWVVFSQVLPGTAATNSQLFLGTAAFVVLNAAVSMSTRGTRSAVAAFGLRVLMNAGLIVMADRLLRRDEGQLHLLNALFFVLLLSLLTLLDDRYRPIYDRRFAIGRPDGEARSPVSDRAPSRR